MQDQDNINRAKLYDDQVNLRELFQILWRRKIFIIFLTLSFSILAIFYSFSLPNIYESETLLAPADESSIFSSSGSQDLSGLAGLAGISIPSQETGSNSKKAIEMIDSLSFFENKIMPNIFLPDLMAVKFWDLKENKIIYDDDIFIEDSNKWVRDFTFPRKLIPSAQESHEVFLQNHFSLSEDNSTSYVSLTIRHQSPFIAKQWTELIVEEINSFYRNKDKVQAEKAVVYLNNQLAKTSFSEIKQVTASLLQKEIQKLTLIEVNENYVFEYIYPPDAMEEKAEPSRILIVLFLTFLGCVLSIIIVLSMQYFSIERKQELKKINN